MALSDQRALPAGWIKQWDETAKMDFYVDTRATPARSIWCHPLDDPQYISSLSPAPPPQYSPPQQRYSPPPQPPQHQRQLYVQQQQPRRDSPAPQTIIIQQPVQQQQPYYPPPPNNPYYYNNGPGYPPQMAYAAPQYNPYCTGCMGGCYGCNARGFGGFGGGYGMGGGFGGGFVAEELMIGAAAGAAIGGVGMLAKEIVVDDMLFGGAFF